MNLSSLIYSFLKMCFKESMPHVIVSKLKRNGEYVQGYVEMKGEQYLIQIKKANTIKSDKNRLNSYLN